MIFHPLHVSSEENANEVTDLIYVTYGENAVSFITYKRWYRKFRQKDFSLEDKPCNGHPQKSDTKDVQSTQTEKEVLQLLGDT